MQQKAELQICGAELDETEKKVDKSTMVFGEFNILSQQLVGLFGRKPVKILKKKGNNTTN